MDHYLLIFAVLFDVFLWVIGNIADLAIYICFWRNFMKYEATSLGGKKIQGELVMRVWPCISLKIMDMGHRWFSVCQEQKES